MFAVMREQRSVRIQSLRLVVESMVIRLCLPAARTKLVRSPAHRFFPGF